MKNLNKYLLSLLLIVAALPVFADSATIRGIEYYCDNETGKALVHKWHDCSGAITIPESISLNEDKYTITEIGDEAFSDCKSISSVVIPESIVKIGKKAFSGCNGMISVTIPKSIERIGVDAFNGCTGLNWVYISDLEAWCDIAFESSASNPLKYAHDLYLDGELISELKIPESIEYIKSYAFTGSYITSLDIPENVTEIGDEVFSGCVALTSVIIPKSLRYIAYDAFNDCNGLNKVHISDVEAWCNITFESATSNPLKYARHLYLDDKMISELKIPEGITAISNFAFTDSYITSLEIPENVKEIGREAFSGCVALTSVTLPETIDIIYGKAFAGCTGLMSLTLPNSVKIIYEEAFKDCSGLTSINIPASLKGLRENVFTGCTALVDIHIADLAAWCKIDFEPETFPLSFLHKLYLGDELIKDLVIPYGIKSIGYGLFAKCSNLISVTIPSSVTDISAYAFFNCNNLRSATVGMSVSHIGKNAFSCYNLTEVKCYSRTPPKIDKEVSPMYPDYPYREDEYIYYFNPFYDTSIATLYVPKGCKEAYAQAPIWCDFSGIYDELTEQVDPNMVIVDGIKYLCDIQTGTAIVKKGLECKGNITIPENVTMDGRSYIVTSIGEKAFSNYYIVSVIIPNTVIEIGTDAFHCHELTSATLGKNVAHIGKNAFYCPKLIEVNCSSITPPEVDKQKGFYADEYTYLNPFYTNQNVILRVPIGCKEAYREAPIWRDFNIISDDLYNESDSNTFLADGVVYYCDRQTCTAMVKKCIDCSGNVGIRETVTIDGVTYKVTSIQESAFSYCSMLESLTIPDSVTEIGANAFTGCSALTTLNISKSMTSIGQYTFSGCTGLISLDISDSVVSIGDKAFSGCTGLKKLTIPASLSEIGMNAFADCEKLEEIHISDLSAWCNIDFAGPYSNPLRYAHYLYLNGSLITDLIIPQGIELIKQYAFQGCVGITTAKIPDSITKIGKFAFSGCSRLKAIALPESVTEIGSYAFNDCSRLGSVTIPASVTSIGDKAFYCSRIETIYCYNKTPINISNKTFRRYNATLYVPSASIERYRQTDVWKNFTDIREIESAGNNDVTVFDEQQLPTDYYNLDGLKVATAAPGETPADLPSGTYIIRCGTKTEKVIIR